MKKILLTLSAAAIALGFASCKKEEQSVLDLGAFSGQAVVKGRVSYNSGYNKTGDDVNFNFNKVAANQTINWELINEDGSVIQTGSVTTDSNGAYSIDFPATENTPLEANLIVQFEADKFSEPEELGDAPKAQKYLFSGAGSADVYPNITEIVNIIASGQLITPDLN